MDKRLIEWNMPLNYISENASKEGKKGHPSTIHTWWARRPLNISRTTIFASLTNLPDDIQIKDNFIDVIKDLSKPDKKLHVNAINKLFSQWGDKPPKIFDPFAGGGSIPFEAMKLGCETYANDLNPVAVIILKALLQWPSRWTEILKLQPENKQIDSEVLKNKLANLVQKYSQTIEKIAFQEINQFFHYKTLEDKNPLAFYWVKIFPCPNQFCGVEIPLLRNFHLSNKPKKKIALKPVYTGKKVAFNIVSNSEIDFNPSEGAILRGKFKCLICHHVFPSNEIRKASFKLGLEERLVAIIIQTKDGKKYFKSDEVDQNTFNSSFDKFNKKISSWSDKLNPIPDEMIRTPTGKPLDQIIDPFYVHLQIVNYGFNIWGDLFNQRQKLTLITFLQAYKDIQMDLYSECKGLSINYAKELRSIVSSYIALVFNRFMSYNNNLNRWVIGGESVANCFSRTGLAMVYDYPEINPFADSFGWKTQLNWILEIILKNTWKNKFIPQVSQYSATDLPFKDNFFDAVVTDPPYYDNVPYADLSDFFYVLFKRTIGDFYPKLFSTPLSPKLDECIANENLLRRKVTINYSDYSKLGIKDKTIFNDLLTQSFKEIYRILKPDGITIIVYAHKTNEGWETLIDSLHKSGLVVTASWPFHTEMKNRLRARSSAALASSVYMICRKRTRKDIGFFSELTEEAKSKIYEKLNFFWKQGIFGGDFFISSIGPALEVFLQYKQIENYNGDIISARMILDFIRQSCTNYVLNKLLNNASIEIIDKPSLFYLLFRWTFLDQDSDYEEARKLALSTGLNLEDFWNKKGSFITKQGSKIKVLDSSERQDINGTNYLIDGIHQSIKYWENDEYHKIKTLFSNFKNLQEEFWLLSQAIIESLDYGMSEKKLLEGFLLSKKKIIDA
jgi:adenine-specific DNA methylase